MLHLLGTDVASDGGFGHLACLWLQHLCFSSFFWGLLQAAAAVAAPYILSLEAEGYHQNRPLDFKEVLK